MAEEKAPIVGTAGQGETGCCAFPWHGIFAMAVTAVSTFMVAGGLAGMAAPLAGEDADVIEYFYMFNIGAICLAFWVFLIGWQKFDPGNCIHENRCCKALMCCFGTCCCDYMTQFLVWFMIIVLTLGFGASVFVGVAGFGAKMICDTGESNASVLYMLFNGGFNETAMATMTEEERAAQEQEETEWFNERCSQLDDFGDSAIFFMVGMFLSVIAFVHVMIALTKYTDDRPCCEGNNYDDESQATDAKPLVNYTA